MGKGKRNRVRRTVAPRQLAETLGLPVERLRSDVTPLTFQGRIITPEVIAEMRAKDPEHAEQLTSEWEAETLRNNAPWINDPELRAAEERLWADH